MGEEAWVRLVVFVLASFVFVFSVLSNTSSKELFLYGAPVLTVTTFQCLVSALAAFLLDILVSTQSVRHRKPLWGENRVETEASQVGEMEALLQDALETDLELNEEGKEAHLDDLAQYSTARRAVKAGQGGVASPAVRVSAPLLPSYGGRRPVALRKGSNEAVEEYSDVKASLTDIQGETQGNLGHLSKKGERSERTRIGSDVSRTEMAQDDGNEVILTPRSLSSPLIADSPQGNSGGVGRRLSAWKSDVWVELTLIAACHSSGFLATNFSFASKLPLSLALMLKSAEPLFTAGLAFLAGERYSLSRYCTLLPIVAGIGLACSGSVEGDWQGITAALVSNVGFAGRSVLSKRLLTRQRDLTDRLLFAYTTAISVVLLLPAWIVYDWNWSAISVATGTTIVGVTLEQTTDSVTGVMVVLTSTVFPFLLFNAFCYFLYNQASTQMLTYTSPLTHVIVHSVRRALGILLSILYYRTPMTVNNSLGMLLAFLGVYAYAATGAPKKKLPLLPEKDIV